ncbi:MAG: hypothetical protein KIH62_002970 [Candidatus Kerfeldbacteria bacterium]|nr:hypothetical protein [Candidatus Kerfeldbacteria bacterium]
MKNICIAIGIVVLVLFVGFIFDLQQKKSVVGTLCMNDASVAHTQPMQNHRLYCIQSNAQEVYAANTPIAYSFSIVDDQGDMLKDFVLTHTKLMHVIVVREDLQFFQHLHPIYDEATGEFTISDLTFPADGEYRIFADFLLSSDAVSPITLSEDVVVGSTYVPLDIGSTETTKTFGEYTVTVDTHGALVAGAEAMLTFAFVHDGQPVTDLQEYLGALGHAIILREDTLDFIHTHPAHEANDTQDGTVDFMVTFPEAGKYKVFTQFQRNNEVFTTDVVLTVAEGVGAEAMDHSTTGH